MSEETGSGPLAGMDAKRKKQIGMVAVLGAAVLSILYMRSRSAASAPTGTGGSTAAPSTGGDSIGTIGADLGSGSGSGGYYYPGSAAGSSTVAGAGYSTNSEWYAAALAGALDAGYSNTAAADALSTYLAHGALTADQQRIVRVGLAAAGQPPVGTYNIITAPTPTPSAPAVPAAPKSVYVLGLGTTWATVGWWASAGAHHYVTHLDGHYATTEGGTFNKFDHLRPGSTHTVTVYAVNSAGKYSGGRSVKITTKRK